MDTWQGALDVAGLVPGLGEPADALNGVIWMMRGDCTAAGLSFAAMVPVAGWAATAGKAGQRGLRWAAEAAEFGSRHIDDVSMPTGQRVLAYGGSRGGGGTSRLGDLTPDEIRQIQEIVDQAGRPLEVVGSAARGKRRGVGTTLPIGKGTGTRSDIDYLVPHGSIPYYEATGLSRSLPSLDPGGIISGVHFPSMGPAIRFEPYVPPYFIPGDVP